MGKCAGPASHHCSQQTTPLHQQKNTSTCPPSQLPVPGSWTHVPSVQFISVAQSCPTLFNPMDCSTPCLPVHHQLPEFTQTTHVHDMFSWLPSSPQAACPLLWSTSTKLSVQPPSNSALMKADHDLDQFSDLPSLADTVHYCFLLGIPWELRQ